MPERTLSYGLTPGRFLLVLHEIDKLARELKRPIERSRRMVDVQAHCEREELIETLAINARSFSIFAEEGAEGEGMSHLWIMHFHIGAKLTRMLFRIEPSETVDHVVRLRPVRHHSLPIKKVAPFDHYLRHAMI